MTIRQAIGAAVGILAIGVFLAAAGEYGLIRDTTAQRIMGAVFGMALAFSGNYVPKRLEPLSSTRCAPARAQAYQRFAGWVFVLAGLASAIVWLTVPMEIANIVSMLIIASGVLLVGAVCAIAYRGTSSTAGSS